MGKLFDNPMFIVLILLVIVLLFRAPKLPGMARSLGQSMRIFKSEVKEMKDDGKDSKGRTSPRSSTARPCASPGPVPARARTAPRRRTAPRTRTAPSDDPGAHRPVS